MRRLLFIAAVVLACSDGRVKQAPPPGMHVDTYAQRSASKVDVLWVVDNSGSMLARQENLARNFQSFIGLFSHGAIDYRIAVTTTDIFVDEGEFLGSPRILTPRTPNLLNAFAANIRVGSEGSAFEAGLEAAQMALERQATKNAPALALIQKCISNCGSSGEPVSCRQACPSQHNVEFLRPDAYLYVIFVTDEEDRSTAEVRHYYRAYETAQGIGNDGMVTTAAIVGDIPSNSCGATPGKRYAELSAMTGGDLGSICDAEFAQTLRKLATNAVGLKRKFALSKAPNPDTIAPLIRYPCAVSDGQLSACTSVDRSECKDKPGDTLGVQCTPEAGGPNGWHYEPGTRVVYFAGDSVPGLKSQVELHYFEEGMP